MTEYQKLLEEQKAKLAKKAAKSKIIVVRPNGHQETVSRSKATKIIHEDAKVKRTSAIQEARLAGKSAASEIAQEHFISKVASMFQDFMQEHGQKMDGVRIIFACSKGDASSDYHIRVENYPQSPRTLHRADIQKMADKATQQPA